MSSSFHSQLYNEKIFYPVFRQDLARAKSEVIIESPFLTVHRASTFYQTFTNLVKKGVKIYVITRVLEDLDAALALQSELVISKFEEIGVQPLLCTGNHHRKLAIIDREILWEGSLNILSQAESREIMRRIKDRHTLYETIKFIKLYKLIK